MTDKPRRFAPQWIGIGVAIGAGLGVLFDNIAVGAGMGVALGMALGGLLARRG
jgi:hypothetical protein